MILKNKLKVAALAVAAGAFLGVTSCNYLDVVPAEQATLKDAMKTYNTAKGFLYSCYNPMTGNHNDLLSNFYLSEFSTSTDEYIIPETWNVGGEGYYLLIAKNTATASNLGTGTGEASFWNKYYTAIGQCLLFEEQLESVGASNKVMYDRDGSERMATYTRQDGTAVTEREQWLAESKFLRAYYHFILLRLYGPIPTLTDRVDQSTSDSDFRGRYHFDYVVKYICDLLDEAVKDLPTGFDDDPENLGRATSVMCKGLKARVLLTAASDLWNGNFPYPSWKNTSFTTPAFDEYGTNKHHEESTELVSHEYDAQKWVVAYKACREAIDFAEANGYRLFDLGDYSSEFDFADEIYIPAYDDEEVTEEFRERVMLMRMLPVTSPKSGNKENMWPVNVVMYGNGFNYDTCARIPRHVSESDTEAYNDGWAGFSPYLGMAAAFLTNNGLTLDTDPSVEQSELHQVAGLPAWPATGKNKCDRSTVTNFNVHREPRYYAWIAFNGGDYLSRLVDGSPKHLDMIDPDDNGRTTTGAVRNFNATGFMSMKHEHPASRVTANGSWQRTGKNNPHIMMRLSEFYISLAECAAELLDAGVAAPDGADLKTLAIQCVDKIRNRAGAVPLSEADPNCEKMSLLNWIRNERYIEFYDEGLRYWDLRRWMIAADRLGANVRKGLNAKQFYEAGSGKDPDAIKKYNTVVVANPEFTFHQRQYLYPVQDTEVYSNPQMIQAPGY
jgi:hypothetical protein